MQGHFTESQWGGYKKLATVEPKQMCLQLLPKYREMVDVDMIGKL